MCSAPPSTLRTPLRTVNRTESTARALRDDPSLANSDPLGKGWFFKILVSDMAQYDALMDEPAYAAFSSAA